VLAWRSMEWEEGACSIAQFSLRRVNGGGRLEFSQFAIPSADHTDIADGWKIYDRAPMNAFLEE
jgi:hypothetical protein